MSEFVSYCTLDELKMYMGDVPPMVAHDLDGTLKRFLVSASRAMDGRVTNGVPNKRHFHPVHATYTYDQPVEPDVLELRDDLLEVTTLTTLNTGTTISSDDYLLYRLPGQQYRTPYNRVRLQPDGTTTAYTYTGTPYGANSITGVWGYHDDWANAWEDSGDTVENSPLTISGTSITVNDADGDDINGLPYRFQNFQLLKIESEYVWVTAVDTVNNTLTVRRGVCGTTAAAHLQNVTISVYRPMADIRMAFEMWALHMFRRRDSIGTPDQRPLAAAKGLLIFPPSIPTEVDDMLKPYMKEAL